MTESSPPRTPDQERRFLASIVESSDDAIIGKDLDGVITSWNRGAQRIYGYAPEEVIGRPISLLIPSGMPDELPSIMRRIRRGVAVEHYETTRITRDGRVIPVSLTVSPIRDEDGTIIGASAIARDISLRVQAEEQRAQLLEEARAASRAKSEFIATISHELRTPLNAIMGYAQLLELGTLVELPEKARGVVDRILYSANHLLQLIEEILTFTRTERMGTPLQVTDVELRPLVDEIVASMMPLAKEKGLELVAENDAPDRLRTDPGKLRQILANLLGNAIKFTREGRVTLQAAPAGDGVVFRVSDTGHGIPREAIPHLFEPFWQADQSSTRVAGGTGLGLAIVKRFADALDARLEVESTLDVGSTFTVRVPPAPAQG